MSEFTVILSRDARPRLDFAPWRDAGPPGVSQASRHGVTVVTPNLLLSADLTPRHNGAIYLEEGPGPTSQSVAVSFGWGYRSGSKVNDLAESDIAAFVHSHRAGAAPDVAALGGIFCILSYDHTSESVWICSDLWAQHGFYYGSTAEIVVVSSKASVVADLLKAPIDGVSYLALLRGTGIPPGRTLYSNVWRVTCGRAVHLDGRRRAARLVQVQPLYRPPLRVPFATALDQVIDAVSTVCPFAASRPSTVVDLTGGNDSRLMAAALASARGSGVADRVTFKVVGDETHPDVVIAGRIADMFGWSLQRNARPSDEGYTVEALSQAAVLGDGFQMPLAVGKRLMQETRHWGSFDAHVGSIGGELFRDFFWRHELQNVGRTNRVNFEALLRHRLYAAANDPGRLSEGRFTLADHNAALLQPYRLIVASLPEILNVYALDIIYLHKLMATSYCWILSDLRKLVLPFLSADLTGVSLRVPWKFRARRRLVTAAVRRLNPALAALPTDAGAPMTPLGPSTLLAYGKYALRDARSAYARHFKRKGLKPPQPSNTIPRDLLDFVAAGDGGGYPYDTRQVMSQIKASRDGVFPVDVHREIQVLMLTRMLTRRYPGVTRSLVFDGKDANFGESSWSL